MNWCLPKWIWLIVVSSSLQWRVLMGHSWPTSTLHCVWSLAPVLFFFVFFACFNNALLRVLHIHCTHLKEWIIALGIRVLFKSAFLFDCSCPAIKTCCINSNPLNWTGSPGLHTLLHNGEKWRNRERQWATWTSSWVWGLFFCSCLSQSV